MRHTGLVEGSDHDARLVERVHPPDWTPPTPADRYNLVVLGAGTAGLVAAAGAAGLGARVALVEERLMGGDCLVYGCVPSKALLRSARVAAEVRRAGRYGVRVPDGVEVEFGAVMERMRRVRAGIAAHDAAERFRDLGVDVFLGRGRFAGPERIEVEGVPTLRFHRALVATGGGPAGLAAPGLAEAGYLTNETVFGLTERPDRLLVVGGGPIGCELAQAFARLGSRVVLVERERRLLDREDEAAAALVAAALEADGVDLALGAELAEVAREGSGLACRLETAVGHRAVHADRILVAVGRRPNVEDLGLDRAGIVHDPGRGIEVDDRLRTSNRRVYAAGDVVAGGPRFTHVSDAHARLVLRNALFPGSDRTTALVLPWVTFTDPELARVGHDAASAAAAGIEVEAVEVPLEDVDRAVLDGEDAGFARIWLEAGTDAIAGATIVSRHAGEMIGEVTLAMKAGLGLSALGDLVHPYPTVAEAIRKAGDAHRRGRLTPAARWLLERWFALRR